MPLRILIVSGMSPAAFTAPFDDAAEQAGLPRQRGSPALAGDLRHGASEIQVDVVGAVFGDEHGDRLGDGLRVDAVELDGTQRLGLVVRDEAHRLGRALDERARRDHLAHVEARAEFAAEQPERRVRDAGHGREHDRGVELEAADRERAA